MALLKIGTTGRNMNSYVWALLAIKRLYCAEVNRYSISGHVFLRSVEVCLLYPLNFGFDLAHVRKCVYPWAVSPDHHRLFFFKFWDILQVVHGLQSLCSSDSLWTHDSQGSDSQVAGIIGLWLCLKNSLTGIQFPGFTRLQHVGQWFLCTQRCAAWSQSILSHFHGPEGSPSQGAILPLLLTFLPLGHRKYTFCHCRFDCSEHSRQVDSCRLSSLSSFL